MTLHDVIFFYAGGALGAALRSAAQLDRMKMSTLVPRHPHKAFRALMLIGVLIGGAFAVIVDGVFWLPKAILYWVQMLRGGPSAKEDLVVAASRFWLAQRALDGRISRAQFSSPAHAQQESNSACEEILMIMDDVMLNDPVARRLLGSSDP
jgi:hypothetical protein